jgi:hypothetical protein
VPEQVGELAEADIPEALVFAEPLVGPGERARIEADETG